VVTLSGGSRTGRQTSSAPPRKLTPIDRTGSAGLKTPPELDGEPDSDLQESASSAHSSKIPLPQLSRPVYAEEIPGACEDMEVYAM